MPSSNVNLPPVRPSSLSNELSQDKESQLMGSVMKGYMKILQERKIRSEDTCDFLFGNPKELASPSFVKMLQQALEPKSPKYFGYRMNDASFCELLAQSINTRYGFSKMGDDVVVGKEDVFLTTGNFAGLSMAIQVVVNDSDEVVFMDPGWFAYRRLIKHARGVPKPVRMTLDDSEEADMKDMSVMLDAITDKTRAIILNLPHNPSGKVYSSQWLETFADKLMAISKRREDPVYLISDEAYSDFVYDGKVHESIAKWYPYTIVAYTYNKMTLAPSQRVGYLFLSPLMPTSKESLRRPLFSLQLCLTWAFPSAIMMESYGRLEEMRNTFDVSRFERKRDKMCKTLTEIGYKIMIRPRGTFYILVQTPVADDEKFCEKLVENGVLVLPGIMFETKSCFRICLTATEAMIEQSIPVFRECFENSLNGANVK